MMTVRGPSGSRSLKTLWLDWDSQIPARRSWIWLPQWTMMAQAWSNSQNSSESSRIRTETWRQQRLTNFSRIWRTGNWRSRKCLSTCLFRKWEENTWWTPYSQLIRKSHKSVKTVKEFSRMYRNSWASLLISGSHKASLQFLATPPKWALSDNIRL